MKMLDDKNAHQILILSECSFLYLLFRMYQSKP